MDFKGGQLTALLYMSTILCKWKINYDSSQTFELFLYKWKLWILFIEFNHLLAMLVAVSYYIIWKKKERDLPMS